MGESRNELVSGKKPNFVTVNGAEKVPKAKITEKSLRLRVLEAFAKKST
jgi:hypothetical protein